MEIPVLTRDELLTKWRSVIESVHIWSWTSHHELAFLCELSSHSHNTVEVGSYQGKSAVCMRKANPSARISCIDLPGDDLALSILKLHAQKFDLNHLIGTTSDWCPKWSGDRYDLAFIDGGHLEADVTLDIQNLLPHMAPGAIIAGHDWRHNNPLDGVNVAVEKAFDRNRIHVFESIWHVKL